MMESVKRNITIYLALFETRSQMHFIIKFPFLCLLLLVKNEENCQIDVCLHTHTASCIRNMHGKQSQLFSRP